MLTHFLSSTLCRRASFPPLLDFNHTPSPKHPASTKIILISLHWPSFIFLFFSFYLGMGFNMGEDCCEKVGCEWASPFESTTTAQKVWHLFTLSYYTSWPFSFIFPLSITRSATILPKMEPKVFFANERTFISWLSMAVNLSSISIGVLAFTSRNCEYYFRLFSIPKFLAILQTLYLCNNSIATSISTLIVVTHTFTLISAYANDKMGWHGLFLDHFLPLNTNCFSVFTTVYIHDSHSISFRHVPTAPRAPLRCLRIVDLLMEIRKDQDTWR